jgi:hypothetical protein
MSKNTPEKNKEIKRNKWKDKAQPEVKKYIIDATNQRFN